MTTDVFTTSDQKAYEPAPSLTQPELPFKGAGDEEVATSEVSSATDEAEACHHTPRARCESGVGSERSRSKMTYRERRAARAERLRGWADKREHDAGAVLKSHECYRGDHAFNFQPGHIPERARVIRQDHRAFESLDKARSMSSRADEIDRQAEHAIYSDDPDRVERLREKLAGLEAKRAAIKAKGRGACPRYVLSNLSATINREKKRLAAFERSAP